MPLMFIPFVVLPIVELALLIKVGGLIGFWNTLGIVLLTAFIGANLLRRQGLATLLRANQRMQAGEMPAQEMLEGVVIGIGGALLLTPGFVTDLMGLCCLLPLSRRWLVGQALKRMVIRTAPQASQVFESEVFYTQTRSADPFRPRSQGDVIEGEYERDSPADADTDRLEKK